MIPKNHGVIRGSRDLVYDPKGHDDLVVGLTWFTQKGHGIIRGRRDLLYDSKGHGDLCSQFDLVYDPKRSRGH